jgi:hypothetical protein
LILDNTQRASTAEESTNAILYGVMAATPASQTLALNAVVSISDGLVVNEGGLSTCDTRIESDTEANMLLLDASADQLFLGGLTTGLRVDKGGDTIFVGSGAGLPYGEIYIDNGHTTQTLTTSFAKVTAFNDADHGVNGLSNLMTSDKANSKITITTAGVYKVHAVFSGQSTKVSVVYMAIFVDGVEQNNVEAEVNTVENGFLQLCADGILSIAVNKDVDMRLKYSGAEATVVTCSHVNLNLVMIGS